MKRFQFKARAGDSSAYAGASILASLSNFQKDLSLLPPSAKTGVDVQKNTEVSSFTSGDQIPEVDIKDSTSHNEPASSSREEKAGPSSNVDGEIPNVGSQGINAEVGKIPGSPYELRPLLKMLAGSSSEFDINGSIKFLDGPKEIREFLKDLDSPMVLMSTRRQAYKDSLQQAILRPENIEISFESFPYYLR